MDVKMDLRTYSREFITEFIYGFRKNPCLWKTTAADYKDKYVKRLAYKKLLEISKKYEPNASIDDVKRKIQSLRASHRKERRKVKDSMKSDSATEEVYVPKLWYYKELDFLDDQLEGSSASNVDNTDNENKDNHYNHQTTVNTDIPNPTSVPTTHNSWRPSSSSTRKPPIFYRKKTEDYTNKMFALISQRLIQADDEFDLIGKNVAIKLRNMTAEQKLLAERLINDVMFNGQIEQLTYDSHINLTAELHRRISNDPLQIPIQYGRKNNIRAEDEIPAVKEEPDAIPSPIPLFEDES